MKGFGGQAVVVAVLVVSVLMASGADQAGHRPSAVMAALHAAAAVALVTGATALVWLAVRAVSERRVTRPRYEPDDPVLFRHVREAAPERAFRAAPGYEPAAQAVAVPFPGRKPALPVSGRPEVPTSRNETEEVPR